MSTRRFLLLIAAVLIIGPLVGSMVNLRGLDSRIPQDAESAFRNAIEQERHARRWVSASFEKIFSLGGENVANGALLSASTLKVASDGGIFVVDGSEWLLKEFSPTGELVARYGQGRGQGPGEFVSLTDFDVSHLDEVWIADAFAGRVSVFDRGGNLKRLIKLTAAPHKLVRTAESFTILRITGSGNLFEQFDVQTSRNVRSFGRFLKQSSGGALALKGLLEHDGAGGFIYVGRFVGLLARYRADGTLAYLVKTINAKSFPRVVTAQNGDMWVDREELPNSQSVNVAGGKVYVLTPFEKALKVAGALDVYNLVDGRYLYSIKPPGQAKHMVLAGGFVYTVDDLSLTMWKYSGPI